MNTCEAIAIDSMVTANQNAVACELEGEMVILNLDSGVYFGLNSVGTDIWSYIQAGHSFREVVQHLLTLYNVDPARCEAEVVALLRTMESQRLVNIQSNGI